jgi:hypothetical protein
MATNDELLAVRIPSKLKESLEFMYPDTSMRNNVIRAALKRIVDKKIVITSYEIEISART